MESLNNILLDIQPVSWKYGMVDRISIAELSDGFIKDDHWELGARPRQARWIPARSFSL